jgi:hypothetical protein
MKTISVTVDDEVWARLEKRAALLSALPPYEQLTVGDIVECEMSLLARETLMVPNPRTPCKIVEAPRIHSAFCVTCGFRWDLRASELLECPHIRSREPS